MIVGTPSCLLFLSCLRLVAADMVLTNAENIFIADLYFRSYGSGHPSVTQRFTFSGTLSHTVIPPSNAEITNVVKILRRTKNVWTQGKAR